MESAFGIDHGEINKARLPRSPMPRTRTRAPSRASQIKGQLNRLGEKDISIKELGGGAGRGVANVGGFMQRHPGLTGTALVGGGGAAGYKVLSEKQPRKKKR
jgi:hypothetical protein